MKKIILLLILTPFFALAQKTVDLSNMTENITIGKNCANNRFEYYTSTGDINLQGKTLKLRNVNLIIIGDLKGLGEIIYCGASSLTIYGRILNNPILNGIRINTLLSSSKFELDSLDSYTNVKVYDLNGKYISNSLKNLYKNTVYIVKVEGYKPRKIIMK